MSIVSAANLIDLLRRHRLLTSEQVGSLAHLSQGRVTDPRVIAKALIKRVGLPVYQVNQLPPGHARDRVLGPSHILDRLGQGGQSQVYKARHSEHGWTVALKVIRSELLDNPETRRQF